MSDPAPLTYDALVAEALALIPRVDPAWTDHNPSDPGVALVELLAWLTEQVAYSADQVPTELERALLKLLRVEQYWRPDDGLEQRSDDAARAQVRRDMLKATQGRCRLVTEADYLDYIQAVWSFTVTPYAGVAEARVLAGHEPSEDATALVEAPGHATVVIRPGAFAGTLCAPLPEGRLLTAILFTGPGLVRIQAHKGDRRTSASGTVRLLDSRGEVRAQATLSEAAYEPRPFLAHYITEDDLAEGRLWAVAVDGEWRVDEAPLRVTGPIGPSGEQQDSVIRVGRCDDVGRGVKINAELLIGWSHVATLGYVGASVGEGARHDWQGSQHATKFASFSNRWYLRGQRGDDAPDGAYNHAWFTERAGGSLIVDTLPAAPTVDTPWVTMAVEFGLYSPANRYYTPEPGRLLGWARLLEELQERALLGTTLHLMIGLEVRVCVFAQLVLSAESEPAAVGAAAIAALARWLDGRSPGRCLGRRLHAKAAVAALRQVPGVEEVRPLRAETPFLIHLASDPGGRRDGDAIALEPYAFGRLWGTQLQLVRWEGDKLVEVLTP